MKLSIVIPVYNEGEPLKILCKRLSDTLTPIFFDQYEIILVDDRSRDKSWEVLKEIAKDNMLIKPARLVRNFGQHNALTAGISLASGDYVVLMDCDQHDEPEQIPLLYKTLLDKNLNLVYALREERKDKLSKRWSSIFINKIMQKMSGFTYDPRIGTFRIFTKKVREAYLAMPETNRFLGGMFNWLGFENASVEIPHRSRAFGKSNYTLKKQLRLARLGILSSSTKLLSASIYIGFFSALLSIAFAVYNFVLKLFYDVPLGYSSIIITILLSTSVILIVLGIIGEYLREIVEEVKSRPNFIIESKINF